GLSMEQLVYAHEGRLVTDSLRVADGFGKQHKNVKRDIRTLDVTPEFNALNFEPIKYTDGRGREQTKYLITQEGFTFLALGYKGEQASKFRELYIREFGRMATALNQAEPMTIHALAQTVKALVSGQEFLLEQIAEVEGRLESQITLNSHQQRLLQQAITERVHGLHADKVSRRYAFQQIHRDIKNKYQVSSYRDVLQRDLPPALTLVAGWIGT
ncbi:Rha family transcriptional regulator, partial [Paenibacillus wenxiniae]